MKPLHVVEAALFSAGRPLAIEEIQERTNLRKAEVEAAIEALRIAYAERDSVLEVGKAGTKWAMQVRAQAAEPAAKFAPMEIAEKLLKTLALIAYHQPMKQSELADMIGSKVYDHVKELHERGLIRTRQEGVTKILTTTPAFPEYFGLDASSPDEIRRVMGKLVGIDAPPRKTLDAYPPEAGAAVPEAAAASPAEAASAPSAASAPEAPAPAAPPAEPVPAAAAATPPDPAPAAPKPRKPRAKAPAAPVHATPASPAAPAEPQRPVPVAAEPPAPRAPTLPAWSRKPRIVQIPASGAVEPPAPAAPPRPAPAVQDEEAEEAAPTRPGGDAATVAASVIAAALAARKASD